MKFKTYDEAEEKFYETNDCVSDDSDKEQARVERWLEDNSHEVEEDGENVRPVDDYEPADFTGASEDNGEGR